MVKTPYFGPCRDWMDIFNYSKETNTKKETDTAENVLQLHHIETNGDRLSYKYTATGNLSNLYNSDTNHYIDIETNCDGLITKCHASLTATSCMRSHL
jgi:negative regulator of genetic competence, sporulation and motility